MSSKNDKIISMYGNPTAIQHKIINGLEQNVLDGNVITTPNNVTAHLVEKFSMFTSKFAHDIAEGIESTSKRRIQNMDDLNKHMSDFDYVGLYSQPASTIVELTVFLDDIEKNAAEYTDPDTLYIYKKVVIPRYTTFEIADTIFSTYYPIEIRMNNGTISVTYDTTEMHPLHTLTSNSVEYQKIKEPTQGVELLSIKIPVYQFVREEHIDDLYGSPVFIKSYPFKDKFLAARVFTNKNYSNNNTVITDLEGRKWTELHQVIDSNIYDISEGGVPTVVINPDIQTKKVKITIPPIFISEQLLGTQLKIVIYTTKGEIEYVLGDAINEPIETKFAVSGNMTTDVYSKLLYHPESITVYPIEADISGGNNGLTFEEIRHQVIYGTSDRQVKVSREELMSMYKAYGFDIDLFKDGITNRIYFASRELVGQDGVIISSGDILTVIEQHENIEIPGIYEFEDESITLTPNAIYKYYEDLDHSIPITIEEYISATSDFITTNTNPVAKPSLQTIVNTLNNNTFTISPFYTVLFKENNTALANTFNLNDPKITDLSFISTDTNTVAQLYVIKCDIEHNHTLPKIYTDENLEFKAENEKGKFKIRIYVTSSTSENDSEEINYLDTEKYDITLSLSMDSRNVINSMNQECSFITQNLITEGEVAYFELDILTDYNITNKNEIGLFSFDEQSNLIGQKVFVNLQSKAKLQIEVFDKTNNNSKIFGCNYGITTEFGKLIPDIFNIVNISATKSEPECYTENIPSRYPADQYKRNPDGTLNYTIENGQVNIELEHRKNDIIYEERLVNANNLSLNSYKQFMYGYPIDWNNLEELVPYNGLPPITDETIRNEYKLSSPNWMRDYEYFRIPKYKHRIGDPIVNPILENTTFKYRTLVYNVNIPHMSAKVKYIGKDMYGSTEEFLKKMRAKIMSYCKTINGTRNRLLQNTNIYFKTKRSIGNILCHANNDYPIVHNLEISIDLRIHTYRTIVNDSIERDLITANIIEIVDRWTTKEIFSTVDMCNEIKRKFSTIIHSIDIIGISDNPNIQTLKPIEPGNRFGLKHELVLIEDGTIGSRRMLNIEFISIDNV